MPLLAIAANDTDAAELKYAVLQVESFDRFGQPQQKDIQVL